MAKAEGINALLDALGLSAKKAGVRYATECEEILNEAFAQHQQLPGT